MTDPVVELARNQMADLDQKISILYRDINELKALRDAFQLKVAELEGYTLPPPSRRTKKQEAIAHCPRCKEMLT